MYGLIVSWFFPPATSAEGLVTFKLLRNSQSRYDVVSADNRSWSYDADSELTSPNIRAFYVKAKAPSDWVRGCVEKCEALCAETPYDFIMTRAMPPESHIAGLKMKKKRPGLLWIASMADPIGRNPYDYGRYFSGGARQFLKNPPLFLARIFLWLHNIHLDRSVQRRADLLIFPSEEQCRFTLDKRYDRLKEKALILPHTYDLSLLPAQNENKASAPDAVGRKTVISYLGHLSAFRSARGLIEAASLLKTREPALADRLLIRLVGNMPEDQRALIDKKGIGDMIRVEKPVPYASSLSVMADSDMLLLIDADFAFMENNIFFASKLADYMGVGKPVFGLTTPQGPSARIIRSAGCPVCRPGDAEAICEELMRITRGEVPQPDRNVYASYDAARVAALFDSYVKKALEDRGGSSIRRR